MTRTDYLKRKLADRLADVVGASAALMITILLASVSGWWKLLALPYAATTFHLMFRRQTRPTRSAP